MASAVIIFSAFSMGMVIIVYSVVFMRYDRPEFCLDLDYSLLSDAYPREEVFFRSGKNRLAGYIYGRQNTRGLILLAHGMGGGSDTYLAQIIYFVEHGWQVFSFDFTGSYKSDGDSIKGFAQGISDVSAALDYIEAEQRFIGLPVMLFGHSWGGFSVSAVSAYKKHSITGIVSVSAPESAESIMLHYAHKYLNAYIYTQIPFLRVYEHLLFGRAAGITATDGINAAKAPVFIIHSEKDTVVPFGLSIIAACKKIKNPNVRCEIANGAHTGLLYKSTAEKLRSGITSSKTKLSNFDLRRANEIDPVLMGKINNFFSSLTA